MRDGRRMGTLIKNFSLCNSAGAFFLLSLVKTFGGLEIKMGDWNISDFLGVLLILMIMQVIGTHLQVKKYRKAVSKLHKLGNLGVGAKRGKLGGGNIVIIACKADGKITGAEEMKGMTIFAGFKEIPDIVGRSIYDLKIDYLTDEKKYKAHLQAIEALEIRLKNDSGGEKT